MNLLMFQLQKKTLHPSNHKLNHQWFKLRAAIRKELNPGCQSGEENIVATKKDGSYNEGEMEHIDDELDEDHENLIDDDLEKHLAKKLKNVATKTTKKGKGVKGLSPLKKGKMKKNAKRMSIATNTRRATRKTIS